MKLFLASVNPNGALTSHFEQLVGKPSDAIRLLLIENAADPYPDAAKGFVQETRADFEEMGVLFSPFDLSVLVGKQVDWSKVFAGYDVVWVGGGNTYYLRWLFQQTGLDLALRSFLEDGLVYGGGSAGAVIVGPTLQYFGSVDDPRLAPCVVVDGLGLTDTVVVPHWGDDELQNRLVEIRKKLDESGHHVVTIRDSQALVVNGVREYIVP